MNLCLQTSRSFADLWPKISLDPRNSMADIEILYQSLYLQSIQIQEVK